MLPKSQPLTILGIETSCDDTAVAIVRYEKNTINILANTLSSQITLHSGYGGIIPNLAAREHIKNILPVLKNTLREARLSPKEINAIAVTQGPGLIPALLIGTTVARTLSWLWKKPLIGIHHIEGHIYANFIGNPQHATRNTQPTFPLLALVVSGGHTQLILMRKHFDYKIIGETQDDAAGEAFDKVARILGLGYPGGPVISHEAAQQPVVVQFSQSVILPRPMLNSPDSNFSFSGLKTAVLYTVQKFREKNRLAENVPLPKEYIRAVCAEFQQATIDVLVKKTIKTAKKFSVKTVILAGGVSANTELRVQLGSAISQFVPSAIYHLSPIALSTDNAAMIASAGAFRFVQMSPKEKEQTKENWHALKTHADLTLASH